MMRCGMTGLLVFLLMGVVIGSIFYMPSTRMNPLISIPAHAQIICRSVTPNPELLALFQRAVGWDAAERLCQTLALNPLTLARVSPGGRDRRDLWVAVSGVGSRAVSLRWKMKLFPPDGVTPSRSYGAWPVWGYSDPSLPSWMRIRFSITDGLLICSISDDSHDIYYLLDTLDGRRPSAQRKEEI